MYHPIQRTRNFFEAVRLTVLNFQRILYALVSAIDKNTVSNAELLATAKDTLVAAQQIQKAAAYLERADQHSRRSSGHEVPSV